MKQAIAFLILILSGWGASNLSAESRHWNKARGYQPFKYAEADGILMDNQSDTLIYDFFSLPEVSDNFRLKFRSRNINGNPSKKYEYLSRGKRKVTTRYPHWGFFLTSDNDTIIFTFRGGEKVTALETTPVLEGEIFRMKDNTKATITLSEKVNPYDGDNLWNITLKEGELTLQGGDTTLPEIFKSEFPDITGFGYIAGWGDKVLLSDVDLYFSTEGDSDFYEYPLDVLDQYLSESDDEMEGYWVIFDRDLEESLIKLGGNYRMACVKEEEGYNFLYLEGATVNSKRWKAGDLKMTLTATEFPGIYAVRWIDALKSPMSHDLKAQRGEGETLTIQFPYQSSKLRLRKVAKE